MFNPKPNAGTRFKQGILSLLFAMFWLAGTAHAINSAGQVVLATGAVSAVSSDGQVRVLAKGSEVFPGDRITTASKSLCVLKMVDDAKMTIRANSEIVIEEYSFGATSDDSSVMELVKGGFRTLTGKIGSNNPAAYQVNSDLSVLGIRGTDYDTRICVPGSCIQIGGGGPEYGQYTNVEAGSVFMNAIKHGCVPNQTDGAAGTCIIDIVAGQTGFAGPGDLKILADVPSFIVDDPTPSPADVPDTVSPLSDIEGCRL